MRCVGSLVIRKMQIKTKIRYSLLNKLANIRKPGTAKNWQNMITQEGSYSESNLAVKEAWQPFSSHKTFQVGNTHPSLHSPNHLEPKLSHCFLLNHFLFDLKKTETVWESESHRTPVSLWEAHLQTPTCDSLRLRQARATTSHNHCRAVSHHVLWKSCIRDSYCQECGICGISDSMKFTTLLNIANAYISPIEQADITKYKDLCWFLTQKKKRFMLPEAVCITPE